MKRLIISLLAVPLLCFMFVVAPVKAVDPFGGIDCSGKAAKSAVCQDKNNPNNNPLTGRNGVIMTVTRIIAIIAGIAAVVIIVVSGFRLVTAGGDTNEVAGARRAIIYSLVGLLVIFLAQAIVGLVVGNI